MGAKLSIISKGYDLVIWKSNIPLNRDSGESRARSEAFCAIQSFQAVPDHPGSGFHWSDHFLRMHKGCESKIQKGKEVTVK